MSDTVGDQVVSQAADVVSSSSTAIATTKSSAFTEALLTPAMTMLNGIHDLTGLPWWLSIAIATVTIRTALLPVTVMTMKNSAKMQALRDDIAYRREAVMEAARTGDRKLSAARQADMQVFMRNAGIAPARVLIGPLVQFPVFISFFVSIRRLAVSDPTFTTGGILWFSDLSAKDPNYILPVLCGLTLIGMTELGGDTGSASATPQMRMFMRAVSVLSVPMTSWFPTAIFCYWIPNNLLSMSLGAAMRRPSTRKALGMAIDPATIVGTRAYRARTLTRQSMSMKESARTMDPAVAAASYNVARPSSVTGTAAVKGSDVVKPVLLKSRPKRAKTKNDNAAMKQFD